MQYREVPKTGEKLSILGFGCMRLPVQEGRINEDKAAELIRLAIDNGVNYLDTAWPYHSGESENFLGRTLTGGYREKVHLATKLPSWMMTSRRDMDFYLNAQLQKLKTEQIDFYLLHALNGYHWANLQKLGVLDFLNQAKADGRIRNAGFSFHGLFQDFQEIVDAYPWEVCQIQYNYLDEELQAGTAGLRLAAARGLGVIVMEPLRGGSLGMSPPPPDIASIWQQAETMRSPAEWALQWVWDHPEVTAVLSGMNEATQIRENLAIAERAAPNALNSEEKKIISRAAETYRRIMPVPCTGCGYCKPCPEGVDIPNCFDTYNTMHMFGSPEETKYVYAIRLSGMISGQPGFASQCIQCGECLDKCPQELQIPELLENVINELEDSGLEERIAWGRKYLNLE